MEIKEWIKVLKGKKVSLNQDRIKNLECFVSPDRTAVTLKQTNECFHCKNKTEIEVNVCFFKPQEHLTIFEAETLFYLFGLNKKPREYAGYHNCIAGKRFIENIKEVDI